MKKLFIALFLLCFIIPCFGQTWELAIAKRDEDGLRKKTR